MAAFRGLRGRGSRTRSSSRSPTIGTGLRRLLSICSVRDRAIVLLMLDTGLRVSEVASIRLGDLRPDGTLKVRGKGSRERMVPVGSTARRAIVRYLGQRGAGRPDDALSLGRRGEISARGLHSMPEPRSAVRKLSPMPQHRRRAQRRLGLGSLRPLPGEAPAWPRATTATRPYISQPGRQGHAWDGPVDLGCTRDRAP